MESKLIAMVSAVGAAIGARGSRLSRNSRLPSWSRAQWQIPRIIVLFAFCVAKIASADVVIDSSSEIVLPKEAPYATRLAAEELNYFLKGVFGAPLPVVSQRTVGKMAIVLGGGRGATALPVGSRVPRDRDGYIIEAKGDVLCIF